MGARETLGVRLVRSRDTRVKYLRVPWPIDLDRWRFLAERYEKLFGLARTNAARRLPVRVLKCLDCALSQLTPNQCWVRNPGWGVEFDNSTGARISRLSEGDGCDSEVTPVGGCGRKGDTLGILGRACVFSVTQT